MMEIMQYIVTSLPTLNRDHEEETKDSRFIIIKILFKKIYVNCFSRDANLKFQLLLLKTVQKVCLFDFLFFFCTSKN